ncbi:MAG TPA: RodZ domain-containing protein [Dongiaceae bacterium]|nr:RodZ domain-containing protein [Dongiaceae bacterium]
MLRRRREEVGQDLAAISAVTHIKPVFLKAIEEGRRKDLPGTAYMIGYIRTYADYLGFDGNRLITDYHAELAGQRKWIDKRAEPVEEPPAAISQIQANPVLVLGGVVIMALAAYGVWSIVAGDRGETETVATDTPTEEAAPAEPVPSEEPEATAAKPPAPSPTNAEASTGTEPTAEDAPPAAESTPAEAPPAAEDQVPPEADVASTGEEVVEESPPQQEAAAQGEAGKIVVRARLESWIQISNEKKEVVFSRVLRSGETYTVPEDKGLTLTTGNAGGIEILVNGKKLKSLGTVGLVKRDIPLDPKKLQDGSAFKTSKAAPVTN